MPRMPPVEPRFRRASRRRILLPLRRILTLRRETVWQAENEGRCDYRGGHRCCGCAWVCSSWVDAASDSVTTDSKGPWPEINLDEVPFGEGDQSDANSADSSNSDTSGNTDSSNSKDSSDASANTPASGESTASKQPKKTEDKVVTADKQSKKVPDPKQPENTTAYEIDNRQFLSNPDGQQGYGYYVHLSQPQKAYRMVIKIRSSGGQGYIRVNATNSPSQGEQVRSSSLTLPARPTSSSTRPWKRRTSCCGSHLIACRATSCTSKAFKCSDRQHIAISDYF